MSKKIISRRNSIRFAVAFFIILYSFSLFAQEKITIKGVKGNCIVANITPEQAEEKALLEAKKEALKRAGVGENIAASDILSSRVDKQSMDQVFNSFSTIELNGEVLDYTIIDKTKKLDDFGNINLIITIDAIVIKYDKQKDPEFDVKIENLEEFYKEGSKLEFYITPFQNTYLKVFFFDDKLNCSLIFPNEYENSRVLEKEKKYKFPLSQAIDYTLETEYEREINYLVMIFTKKDIPFIETVNYKNLLKWINGISPDQRVVKYYNYIIKGIE